MRGFSPLADGTVAAGIQWNSSINATVGTYYEITYSTEISNLDLDINNPVVSFIFVF